MEIKRIYSIRSVRLKDFKRPLAGVEPQYSDLIMHTEVRCINTAKIVSGFLELGPQVTGLLKSINEKYKQLTNAIALFRFLIDSS
jgi:hypothetical protein